LLEGSAVIELAAPPSHERVFTPFCREIIEAVVVQNREASRALTATVRAWQSAWKPVRQEMDKATQVGLFGELVVLRYLLLPSLGRTLTSDLVAEQALVQVSCLYSGRSVAM
jgi:Putative  PD-(D/E)XK family member, (DUF4420)